jgi:hypothetical protein
LGVLIENIISQLKDIQGGKNWIGSNFEKKLQMVSEAEAFQRPLPDLHSVAEIMSHLTAWRKDAILKLRTGKGILTEGAEENWLRNEKLRDIGWKRILTDHRNSFSELIELLRIREDTFLKEKYYDIDFKGYFDYKFVIDGMLHHDIYHLGQLGIIIKFLKAPI